MAQPSAGSMQFSLSATLSCCHPKPWLSHLSAIFRLEGCRQVLGSHVGVREQQASLRLL